MKIFDLCCVHDHRFEGWFASGEAFEDQLSRGLVSCPLCSETQVRRLPSAPHLNISKAVKERSRAEASKESAPASAAMGAGASGNSGASNGAVVPDGAKQAQMTRQQGQFLDMLREVIQNTENVGDAFAEEARKIHYREAPERSIRGVASPDQVAELADEGIDVLALPIPDAVKGTLQ
jgi:hypothetical protein